MSIEELEPWLEKALDIVKIIEIVILSVINHRIGKTEKGVTSLACNSSETTPNPVPDSPQTSEPLADNKRVTSTRLRDAAEAEFKKALDLYFSDTATEEMTPEQLASCARVTNFLEK